MTIYTIGHSTHTYEEFVEILRVYKIQIIVDVRSLPGSNRYPQYNYENLGKLLPENGIRYMHLKKLGGLRKGLDNSVNLGWRNKSFRGYADYMQKREFKEGIEELIEISKGTAVCIMCAEAVPWRCHRSLISDALLARKIKVEDIFSKTSVKPHELTSFAKVEGEKIIYPSLK